MTTPPSWRPLPVSPSTGLPNLLVSTTFSTNEYIILVTDMAHVWSESLDRRAIYQRSLNLETTIDPTFNPKNMATFLSKIASVFDESHADHNKASMTLSLTPNKDAGEEGLTMNITCELENAEPLEWPVYLQKCPQSKLATDLFIPLAQASSAKTQQVESLLEIVQQKDKVILKLLDKLEATGTRLDNVFALLAGKQKPTREMAQEKIKGLAPLRIHEWRAQLDGDKRDIAGLIQDVFGASGLEHSSRIDLTHSNLDDWWTKNATSNIPIVVPGSKSIQNKPKTPPSVPTDPESAGHEADSSKTDAGDDDGDFQFQSTPPRLKSRRNRTANAARTQPEDEDPSQIPDSFPPQPEPKSHSVRLGTIGKKRQPTPVRSSPPAASFSKKDGSETETASEDDATASLGEPSSPPQPPPKGPKGGLVRIGRGSKPSEVQDRAREIEESTGQGSVGRVGGAAQPSKSPEPRKKVGLGRIGGGSRPSKTPEPAVAGAEEERGRHRTEPKAETKPRETSQERANKKRDDLQKDLQQKAAAGPAKKKRKF